MIGGFKKFGLVLGDVLVLFFSLYLTLIIRYRQMPSPEIWHLHWPPFSVLFLVWLVVFYITGLYDMAASRNDVDFYNKILRNMLINFGIAAGYFYFLTDKLFDIKPQAVFFIFIAIVAAAFPLWRFWFNSFFRRPAFLKRVLVVGITDEARELVSEISRKPILGYVISAIVHNSPRHD